MSIDGSNWIWAMAGPATKANNMGKTFFMTAFLFGYKTPRGTLIQGMGLKKELIRLS
jgi:hypothetical protein